MHLYCNFAWDCEPICVEQLGDFEAGALALVESSLKYQPGLFAVLTLARESGSGTVHGGQFDWGGLLQKSNGGVRRYARYGRKSY